MEFELLEQNLQLDSSQRYTYHMHGLLQPVQLLNVCKTICVGKTELKGYHIASSVLSFIFTVIEKTSVATKYLKNQYSNMCVPVSIIYVLHTFKVRRMLSIKYQVKSNCTIPLLYIHCKDKVTGSIPKSDINICS